MIQHGRIGLRCHVHYLCIHTVADVYPVDGTAVRLHRNNASVMESLMLNEWKPTAGRCRGCLSETFTGCSETGCESSSAFLLLTCRCALCSSVLRDSCDVLKETWKSRVRCFCVDVSEAVRCYLSLGCFCILLSLLSVRITSFAICNEYVGICFGWQRCRNIQHWQLTWWRKPAGTHGAGARILCK